ncbi:hypothetical protein HGRIS_004130 [Hohenbuehelia grisea]|uniref:D-xylose 1-dehydrogenase (NADP(+), D-xylono-1,5-lactone-forming) n=1 Tax=Hohenbuehelia grisea TaxID=104357 RepID=A0ABR3JHK2_9AGAR
MGSMISFGRRNYKTLLPVVVPRSTSPPPIRFGILGAANIAPIALIVPAKSHPEVVIQAVAARDKARAETFAKKHGIAKAYGGEDGYQELLDDPDVDAVYNPLPNGLHFEWTIKALNAGKHVLLEKPSANTAEETRQIFDLAEQKGLVILEAFHYRFHPAIQRAKAILDSSELGAIKSVSTALAVPNIAFKENDIRFDYSLGGGVLMDMGCYTINCMRYLSSGNPTAVIAATSTLQAPRSPALLKAAENVDRRTTAAFALPGDATGEITCDLGMPPRLGFIPVWPEVGATVECTGGKLEVLNFVGPSIYHSITVTKPKPDGKGTEKRVEKAYTFPADGSATGGRVLGEDWWSTYRFQLEAFVDRLRGRTPQTWVDREDSIANMEWIERVYEKTGLGSRPRSTYVYDS